MFWSWGKSRQPALSIEASLLTNIGCRRTSNEDAGEVVRPSDRVLADKGMLMMVADGMGGCEGGEIASQLAVETVRRSYYANSAEIGAALVRAFTDANQAIHRLSVQRPELNGMGTTCTALVLCQDLAWVAYVGDTRLYLIRNNAIYRMVEDHSAVMELVKQGLVSREEARRHEDRNVLLRALGTHEEIEVGAWNEPMPVRLGDRFVVCSDGLYDVVEDEEILKAARFSLPEAACIALVALARQRDASDNITVGVARVGPPAAAQTQAVRETRVAEVTQ
jgi:PPM family protein phosphatase